VIEKLELLVRYSRRILWLKPAPLVRFFLLESVEYADSGNIEGIRGAHEVKSGFFSGH
jgi:hypothetical protein